MYSLALQEYLPMKNIQLKSLLQDCLMFQKTKNILRLMNMP